MRARSCCLLILLFACDDDASDPLSPDAAVVVDAAVELDATPEVDAAIDAALEVDAAPAADAAPEPDAGPPPDMGPPPPTSPLCTPCGEDGACPDGAICLTNQNTGEQFCGQACGLPGTEACPRGSSCIEIQGGARQCAPAAGSCAGWPPSDQNAPCEGDADCVNGATTCVEAGDRDYCSSACERDRDCPVGASACVGGLCRADWTAGPEGCGRGALPACDAGECAGDTFCFDGGAPTAPFCTSACEGDGDCPDETRCAAVGEQSVCVEPACDCLEGGDTLIDEALALAGLDRCTATFLHETYTRFAPALYRDRFRLGFFNRVHDHPVTALRWGRALELDLAERGGSDAALSRLVEKGAELLDRPLEVGGAVDPPDGAPMVEALAEIWAAGGRSDRFNRELVTERAGALPEALRRDLGRVLQAMANVVRARDRMLSDSDVSFALAASLFEEVQGTIALGSAPDMTDPEVQDALAGGLDLTRLFSAGRDLAATIEAIDWSAHAGAMEVSFELNTPLGAVRIQDAGEQMYAPSDPLLVVDLGGDDTYHGPVGATRSFSRPVSVLIDLGGDDVYGYPEMNDESAVPPMPPADEAGRNGGNARPSLSRIARQGAGILGVGLLVDLAGNDTYRSLKMSQGAGVLGLGMLHDAAGTDDYACEQGCQGAGSYGMGLLVDGAGDDRYLGAQAVQGYAYVRAFGYLHDQAGSDRYTAVLGDPELGGVHLYPNAQNPGRSNTSLAQGAGFGRRADFTDGVFASGGLGAFRDSGDGDDHYTVDIFGQGTGFWFGTGLFSDGGGNDTYNGRWYNQGSGAHYALNYFFENGGDDSYNRGVQVEVDGELQSVILATAVGQGHDYTLGFLVDFAGDDHYVAPGLGMGGGNDNGVGFFLEGGGNDTYDAPIAPRTFGGAAIGDRPGFEDTLCLGIFVDADGEDVYVRAEEGSPVGNDRRWSQEERVEEKKPGEFGAGIDVSGGELALP